MVRCCLEVVVWRCSLSVVCSSLLVVVRWSVFVACCLSAGVLFGGCCVLCAVLLCIVCLLLLFDVSCLLCVVCGLLHVIRRVLFLDCCLSPTER